MRQKRLAHGTAEAQHAMHPVEVIHHSHTLDIFPAGEGPAAHHTILADPILRSGRPVINTARFAEKTPKIPRTPKTPAKVAPAPPTHYESGGQMWPIPACSLDSHHCSQLGHGRISVKAAFSGATIFITGEHCTCDAVLAPCCQPGDEDFAVLDP